MLLLPEQIQFYRTHGYLVVEEFLTKEEVQLYEDEAQQLTNYCYEQGDIVSDWGCVIEPLGCGYYDDDQVTQQVKSDRLSYISLRAQSAPRALPLCTLGKFGLLAQQLLSQNQPTYLLNEQYIVKPPHSESAQFAWHQDVLYFSESQRQHSIVSVWTPLTSVSECNGTVLVEPFHDPENPGVYRGMSDERGSFAARMEAGSAMFMDGRLRHCSSGNRGASFRVVYMPQFSVGRIQHDGGTLAALAIPLEEQACITPTD